MMSVLFSFFLLIFCVKNSFGVRCLDCQDIPQSRECRTVVECLPGQVCYHDMNISPWGQNFRNVGCRDKQVCSTSGRRRELQQDRKASGDVLVCSECCDSDICQPNLCKDTPFPVFPTQRGPLCYDCATSTEGNCRTFIPCSIGEMCTIGKQAHSFSPNMKTMGCLSERTCNTMTDLIGKRDLRRSSICFKCCNGDLCNNRCPNSTLTLTSTFTTTTSVPK